MQILKRITMLAFVFAAFAVTATAQLTGTKVIPGDYPSVAAAVTDLNTQGVGAGGVTFAVVAGYAETAPAGGFTINNPAGNGASNPIVFRMSGSGARPAFTANAALTAGALNDAIFKIIGTDYVTIDGFQMLENAANTNTTAATNTMTEFGVALFYATTTNGSQNVTVQNCIITLNRTYPNTFGVYSNSTTSATAVTTSATATTADGGNSGLKLYSNSISNVNIGIVVVGPTAAADQNEGLDIGGTAMATGNSVTDYGTTTSGLSSYANVSGTINGILVRNTRNFNVSYNSVVSSNGGTTAGTLRGIYVPSASNTSTTATTNSINNNNVSVRSGVVAGTVQGIIVEGGAAATTATLNINANDFTNSGHTVAAASGAITFISNVAIVQNTNINNNTFTNMSVTTTGSVTFLSNSWTNSAVGGIKNVNGNSVVTAFSKTGAGGTITWFTDNGSDVAGTFNNSNNNNFSNITATGATTILGLSNTNGGSPTKSVTGNTVSNLTGGTSALTGMVVSFSGSATVNNNQINTLSCACTLIGLSTASGGTITGSPDNFSQNTIHTLSSSGALTVTGIVNSGGTVRNLFRNKIYNLENTNAGGLVNGVTISGGTTINLYNNLIGDLRAPAATSATTPVATDSVRGINITSTTATTTLNVSFNTVYLNATSTGANFSSSALFATTSTTATSATLNLRNNILVNLSTPVGTGVTAAYRRSSADLTNYGSVSNNNDFYAGVPSATRLIFYDGTNSDQTLAAYKARVSPRDSNSISENPNFLSTTGSNANFLHINPATPTQLESGGIPVSGITDDFDAQTRNATTPDIGADEFTGTPIDLSAPTITYTPVGNTTQTTNRVITATITDLSGVAGGANSPRIYFRKNGGAYSSTQCVLTGGSSYDCTIDYSLVGGVAVNDVIDYFIVAQDTNGNVGANPSAGFSATNVNNVTSPPTNPNTYTIVAGTAASINVGAGETYTSLTNTGGVFAALNAGVLTNNVTINITSDLTAETGAVFLNQQNEEGAGAGTYTVTIKPSGAARVISGTNASGALIRINGADRVTIDGSLSNGTDRSLTITNNSTATSTAAIQISSLGVNAGATNNTIKNTNISGGADQSTSTNVTYGISHGGALLGNGGADNDNNSFINNAITKVNIGIYSSGESAANPVQNTVMANNLIGPAAFGSDQIGRAGIIFNQSNATSVTGNEIRFVGVTEVQTSSGGAYDKFGITHAFNGWSETTSGDLAVSNTTIARNRIHDIVEENTYSAVGIFMAGGNGTNDTLNTTVNNFIWNVRANGTSGDNSASIGIASGRGDTVAYNSIYMAGDLDPLASTAASTSSFGIQIPNTNVVNLNLKNNISYVDLTSNTATLLHGAIKIPASFNWGTGGSNYNDLYVPATNAQMIVGRVGTTDAATLAAYQTASGQEANSKSVDPLFVSATDLHLQSGSPVRASATSIAGITTDIDGDTRNPNTPDMGADEFASFAFPTIQFSAATYTGAEGTTATVTVTRSGDATVASTVNYATSDGTATGGATCGTGVDYQTASGTLNYAVGETNKTFTVTLCSDTVIKGNETINLTLTAPTNATLGTPSTAVLTITNVNPPMPGTLQFSSSTYSAAENGGTASLTVTRTGGSDGAVSVDYALANGTATGGANCAAGVDFVNTGGTVNFATGETSKIISVTICNDAALEGNETFNSTLTGATGGATIGSPSTATVTIIDDEVAQPGTLAFSSATYSVGEAGGTATLTVTRTGGTDGAVAINYTLGDGTATGGASCGGSVDYVNTGGTVNFAAGEASKTFNVTICNDTTLEGNETFAATLSGATGGATIGTPNPATVTIIDDEVAQPGTLAFSSATYTVGENGGTATLTVTRTGGSDGAVSVNYALANGTATGGASCAAGVDFVNTGGTVNFAAGETSKTILVTVCDDAVFEGDETFTSTLSGATGGATIGSPSTATVTITDNKGQPTVQFSSGTYSTTELFGDSIGTVGATITVTLSGASQSTVTVNYATGGGTATGGASCAAGVDYITTSGTLTFNAGETSKTFNVPTCADTVFEGNETVNLTLSNPVGATLGTPSSAVLTIVENDNPPSAGPVTVTATAGTPTATYNTLTEAVAAINAGTHQGAIVVNVNQNLTEPGSVVLNGSGAGAASYTSVLIRAGADGVTVSGASAQGRGLIELNGADNVTIDGDNPTTTGTNRNLTLQNTAANTVTFTSVIRVAVAATGTNSADNNAFRNLNVLGSATGRNIAAATTTTGTENTTFGIFAGPGASTTDGTAAPAAVTSVATSVAAGATATNLVVSNNNVRTAARAISMNGAATTVFPGLQISGNSIGNPTAGEADQVYAIGITAQGSADAIIRENTVWVEGYIASSAAGHGINVGVNSTAITGATIERNKVNRVQNNNGATWSAFGINLGGGNNHVVQNNFVSGVINSQAAGTGGFGSTFGAFGVRIASGTGHKVYHNSVNLYGAMPGVTNTNLTAAFIMTATTQTGVDVRNNIFANQITGGNPTGTRNVAVALPTGGTATMNLTINNNAYYGSGDANSRLAQVGFTFGTGEYTYGNFDPTSTTPATNFRAYTSTLSAAGTNDNASFATTSPAPFTSNSDLHIPAGSATRLESGGAAVGVTNDIDLETRNATTPDIGADEFTGTPAPANDIAAVAFVYPANGSTIQTGTFNPIARFNNNGTATQTNVTVRFRILNSSNTEVYNQTATIATIAPLQNVDVTFPPATISMVGTYTMIASVENPGDTNPANDSITGTFNTVAPLGGTINVGTGETYTSLTNPGGIFQALNTAGISGNTTINITSDLTAETGAIALNQLVESGAGGYTITFKPSGAARVISGSSATNNGLINLNGADRVVFDGSLSGGTDRSLTVTNNQTGTSTVFWIKSASAANGANNNTIKNSIINGANNATLTAQTTAGVLAGSGTTIGGAAEAQNNNNTVTNNQIYRVQNGLYNQGNTGLDQNWTVTNNEFGSTVDADKNRFRGMLMGNATNFVISGNRVLGVTNFSGTTGALSGIQLAFAVSNGTMVKNQVSNVRNLSVDGTGAFGLQLSAAPATNILIANNFVWDIQAAGSATAASNGHGINVNGAASAGGYKIYYNSVNLNTNQTSGTTAALHVGAAVVAAGALDVRNNIFANTQTTNTRYAVYSAAAATVFSTINYNDYFAQNVGFIGGSARPTLADWQAATGQDANSLAVDPLFVSPTDLHLQAGSPVLNLGTPVAGVTDDIDGETRSTTTPDIGADEVATVAQPGTLQFSSATYSVNESAGTATVTVTRTGGSDGTVTVNYATGGGTATGGASCGAGVDYVSTNGTLTFAAGVTSQTFTVTICNDTVVESNETFNYTLTNPTGGATIGTPSTAVQTIVDDDVAPAVYSLSISDAKVVEADSGTTNAVFTVTLTSNGTGTFPVTVQYATANGTAIAGADYSATSGTLTFNGVGTQTITVPVTGDTVKEANETFFVNLSNASANATIADGQGVGIIVDRDRTYLADYDRDFIADFSVYRPSNSTFYVSKSTKGFPIFQTMGTAGDISVPGDYDGDGKIDFALFTPSTGNWTVLRSSDGTMAVVNWGVSTDKPVQGDFTGDGKTDYAVYRPSTGIWYILPNSNQAPYAIQFGISTDRPVQADYDGDFKTDLAVYRDGIWYIVNSSNGTVSILNWGLAADKPAVGDFDGDGRNDLTVYRNGVWYIRRSLTNDFIIVTWGNSTDIPVPADYDADGTTDIAVWRPSTGEWYVLKSSGGNVGFNWGQNGDVPTPSSYLPQ